VVADPQRHHPQHPAEKSAAKYATVWMPEGSPLRVHTERQAKLLKGLLGQRGHHLTVTWAMRYGSPSIPDVLAHLKAEGASRILIVPMYPQYAASTTATVDEAARWLLQTRNQPEMRFIRNFHDHDGYLARWKNGAPHWQANGSLGDQDRLLISFHGLPKRSLDLGDPYFCECHKTGRLLAERLNLKPEQFQICFQSRFGKAEWLQPYTAPTLHEWGSQGVRRVDVICPGFTPTAWKPWKKSPRKAATISSRRAARNTTTSRHSTKTTPGSTPWPTLPSSTWPAGRPNAVDPHALETSAREAIKFGART
jgi:ferrochelatase